MNLVGGEIYAVSHTALQPFQGYGTRVNVGNFGQCRYNRTLLYFLYNFSATSVVIAMCNPDKSQ